MPNATNSKALNVARTAGLNPPTTLFEGVTVIDVAAMSDADFDKMFATVTDTHGWDCPCTDCAKLRDMDFDPNED